MDGEGRRGVDGDDFTAGVGCGGSAALYYFQQLRLKSALAESLGDEPVDQTFSICMLWLSVEVAVIGIDFLSGGTRMLIAKTPTGLKASILDGLTEGFTPEELEAIAAKIRKAQQEKAAKKTGKEG